MGVDPGAPGGAGSTAEVPGTGVTGGVLNYTLCLSGTVVPLTFTAANRMLGPTMKHFIAWLGITAAWDTLIAVTAEPKFWRGDGPALLLFGWPIFCGLGWLGILFVTRCWGALRNAAAPRQVVIQREQQRHSYRYLTPDS